MIISYMIKIPTRFFFVEAPNIQKFIENKQFSKHWNSFEYFIKDYLNYNA